jgi:ectoine hydroxylase-related dioxygenase (phytanoyl-CoA dioxygenase family)
MEDVVMNNFDLSIERKVFTSESVNLSALKVNGTNGSQYRQLSDHNDSNDTMPNKMVEHLDVQTTRIKRHHFWGKAFRTLLLDVPLLIVLLIYAGVAWFSHVHDEYLVPQLKALPFTTDRSLWDLTYYTRECSVDDMSTMNGADLFLPTDASPMDAYRHQLKHGFTVFQKILQPETCENLRNYIVARNRKITEEESIYVIEGENRFSFGLGTEEISVRKALMEIGNSERLRSALEAILGKDPALIELTAITAANGAVAQWWHEDVVSKGSPVQFGRAFGPSYSVFIQLQNTTKEMGATGCCPGTHFCSQGSMEQFCDEYGFQAVNGNGYWGQGDALLMNMNSWHRGSAHTDPEGLDRVMLILTFVPRPIERAETRQLSQGITFSLRWDMWGHTLSDLAAADTAMTQPWTTLRALGLHKSTKANWGIDYVSSAIMRTAGDESGFSPDDLDVFISRGGFHFLPEWLQHFDIDWDAGESWPEFINGTKEKCLEFFSRLSKLSVFAYLLLFAICSIFMPGSRRGLHFDAAIIRLTLILSLTCLLFFAAKTHVDQSGWAKDIVAGRRYTSAVDVDRKLAKDIPGSSTFPTVKDVLIETRHGSEQLAMYNDFVTLGHPGNALFRDMVDNAAQVFRGYHKKFKEATIQYVTYGIFQNQGRFLYQGPDGKWLWLYDDDVHKYVRDELVIASNKVVSYLSKNIRYISSDYKYGKFRNTALSTRHAVPYMESLHKKLILDLTASSSQMPSPKPNRVHFVIHSIATLSLLRQPTNQNKRDIRIQRDVELLEPFRGAWIAQEDEVEIFKDGFWYYATVLDVTGRGDYQVQYFDRRVDLVDRYSIRPFVEYHIGEHLYCFVPSIGASEPCKVEYASQNGLHYTVQIDRIEKAIRLTPGYMIRQGPREKTKYVLKGQSYQDK